MSVLQALLNFVNHWKGLFGGKTYTDNFMFYIPNMSLCYTCAALVC